MKKSIVTIAAAFIMIISFSSFTTKSNPLTALNSSEIINTYLGAAVLGVTDVNNVLFSSDFNYQNLANGDTFNKKQYLQFLDKNKGVQYNCQTQYQMLDENTHACVAKTTMKFANFTRIDYVTLNRSGNGWEITNVVTSYQK